MDRARGRSSAEAACSYRNTLRGKLSATGGLLTRLASYGERLDASCVNRVASNKLCGVDAAMSIAKPSA
jgi:hypothetical protein